MRLMVSSEQKMHFIRPDWGLCQWACQNPQPHLAPEMERRCLALCIFLTHTLAPPSLMLPHNIKKDTLQIFGGGLGFSAEVTHFLVIWYNNRKSGILIYMKRGVWWRQWWWRCGRVSGGSEGQWSFMREKELERKHTNNGVIYPPE